jgi:hypothetical protein
MRPHSRIGEGLELVLALEGGRRRGIHDAESVLGGDGQHRHALVASGDHARQQVGRARARVAQHHGRRTGRLEDAFRHVRARRLVADRDEADALGLEGGEQRIDLGAGQAEDEANVLAGEAAREQLAAGDLGHRTPPV